MGSTVGGRFKLVPTISRRLVSVVAGLVVALTVLRPGTAAAQFGSDRYASLVMEADNGRVLSALNPDELRYPASLTKMMTLFMLFEALRDRRVSLDDLVPVSAHAASMSPSKLGLVPGTRLSVEQAILGLVTKSANDAAAALGELLGGDEPRFAQMMTLRARALGMSHTTFRNASGLPDFQQVTTARDMALLARHLVQDFPDEYRYFSTPYFAFHGRVIMNHDQMLRTYAGADGLKTGYTDAAGHNLVTSAVRGGVRLIGVVLGAGSNGERDWQMRAQLDDGFAKLDIPEVREAAIAPRLPSLISRAEAATLVRSVHAGEPHGGSWARRIAMARSGGEGRIEHGGLHRHVIWRAPAASLRRSEALAPCVARRKHHGACAVPGSAQLTRS